MGVTMDNATVASMQGTVGRTDAGSAPGIACQQMPLSFLKGGETGTIAKVRGRGDLHRLRRGRAGDGGVRGCRRPHRRGQGHPGRAQPPGRGAYHHERRRVAPPQATHEHERMFHVKHLPCRLACAHRVGITARNLKERKRGIWQKFKIERCATWPSATPPPSVA